MARFFRENRPYDLIVNCAAMTDVDACEENAAAARDANALAVKSLADAAAETRAAFIQISTNYVFPGTEERDRTEEDPVGPRSIYGLTKLEGEHHAFRAPFCAVVRTSWIFGGGKRDFVRHFSEKFSLPERIPVVADQRASLTYAPDLAEAIGPVAGRELWPAREEGRALKQIYHIVNAGNLTRYEMLLHMKEVLGKTNTIEKVAASGFATWKAVRPRYSALSTVRYESVFGAKMRGWRDALSAHLKAGAPCGS